MNNNPTALMQNRINEATYGTAFVLSDFTDLADYEAVKKAIARMEKKGLIRRVCRGVYDKPKFSNLLQEYAVPNPDEVAHAIARNYNWIIAGTGNTALNQLGLSTQVPAKWSYISSGPYKKYSFGNITLEFNHRSDNQLRGMSNKTLLMIQAIKALGRDNLGDKEKQKLRNHFSVEERKEILKESRNTMSWIYSAIKEITIMEQIINLNYS